MSEERKNFGEVFGETGKTPVPLHSLRRLREAEQKKLGLWGNFVGIFCGEELKAVVGFNDLFDEEGNRFYND